MRRRVRLRLRLRLRRRLAPRWGGAGSPRVVAVDPTLAFRDFQPLKLQHDKLLSNLAFSCNLRHYTAVGLEVVAAELAEIELESMDEVGSGEYCTCHVIQFR